MSEDQPRWLPLAELRTRRSFKWRAYPPDVLPAFVAEMDVTLAPPIVRSLEEAVARGDTGYAFAGPELGAATAEFQRQRFGWEVEPQSVSLIPDVMTGISAVLRRALPDGGGVVVNTPVYPPFFEHIREAGCQVVEAPLARSGRGHVLDLEAVDRALGRGARAYLLCSPHNPTGRVFTAAELSGIARLAERHAALVLADEIHAPLTLGGARHVPYLSLPEARERGIAFVSATKAWNLPGLKCAQLVTASAAMREVAARLPQELRFAASLLGVIATVAAYREGVAWLDRLLPMIQASGSLLSDLLAAALPEAGYLPPPATYLAWLDCRALGLPEEPARAFLQRGRVALRPGPDFGTLGAGWVRASIATGPEVLNEMVARMRAALG